MEIMESVKAAAGQNAGEEMMQESQKVLKLAVSIGETLLECGGEIYRVQETISRVLEAYGIYDYHVYVVSNGIFATVHEDRADRGSMVREVPLGGVHLGKIQNLNQLSREICEHVYSTQEAWEKLEECKKTPGLSLGKLILCSGMGCAAFCYIFGGTIFDSIAAFGLGMLLRTFVSAANRGNASKFVVNILGSALVTVLSILLAQMNLGLMQDKIVIGSIMILVPGVALTTSIRELFAGDYLSGGIHLTDALLTAICIATGVGAAIKVVQLLGGVSL